MLRLAGLVAFAFALGAAAQSPNAHRIGYLNPGAGTADPPGLFEELSRRGYVEGRNLRVERRHAKGVHELETAAKELVALKVDLIIALATPAVKAAQRATSTIPVVFAAVVDPVGANLVASLRRPGANITGVSLLSAELAGKRLELLQGVVPKLAYVAVLLNPSNDSNALQLRELESAAKAKGVQLVPFEMTTAARVDQVLAAIAQSKARALIALDDPAIAGPFRASIIAATHSRRLPAVAGIVSMADAGLLMAYGPSFPDHFRRVAAYVDRVLKGANPAELPVEQPTEFELVINMKTARALGVSVPPALLSRADRVIE